jgi:hypothetical protein
VRKGGKRWTQTEMKRYEETYIERQDRTTERQGKIRDIEMSPYRHRHTQTDIDRHSQI